jgi:uncharacterized hydrophobic protein (TIGR00271 family)
MGFLQKIKRDWRIRSEDSDESIYQEIVEGIFFRGHNLWLLALAMLIACVGLNAGSIAAVIGAMLISPLMGPVIGFAFGLSIYSTSMMRLSLYHWGIMVSTSIFASTIYFLVTPFHYSTEELDSFTRATIFDVLLAFLGGIAGFIGIIRKEATKIFAGVAVATACIPPLCTAGYGIANADWRYFLGGCYFFSVNCFFIGWGTWLASRFLGYHHRFKQIEATRSKLNWLYIGGILLIIPSIWLAGKKWQHQHDEKYAKLFVQKMEEQFPEMVVLKSTSYRKNGNRFIDISLLNDQNELSDSLLLAANKLDPEVEAVWHFSPNKSTPDVRLLKNKLAKLDSTVAAQEKMLQALQQALPDSSR